MTDVLRLYLSSSGSEDLWSESEEGDLKRKTNDTHNTPNKKAKLEPPTSLSSQKANDSTESVTECTSVDELDHCPSPEISSSESQTLQQVDQPVVPSSKSSSTLWVDKTDDIEGSTKFNNILCQNFNKQLTDALEKVENIYLATGKKWNALGIRKAIAALRQHPKTIKNGREAQHIEGIGQSIANKIDEILETGTLRQLQDEKSIVSQLFNRIWGVGPVTIEKWYSLGYRSLEDLERNKEKELNHMQQLGLKYYNEFSLKIPRKEVEEHGKMVANKVNALFKNCNVEVVGSFRRGRSECGDIDILITTTDWAPVGVLHKLCEALKKDNFITEYLEISAIEQIRDWDHHFDKFMGVSKLPGGIHRRIDIIVTPTSNYAGTLLYFTGSEHFNRRLRLLAKEKGFYLCNHNLALADSKGKRKGPRLRTESEEDIFKHLGLEYTPNEGGDKLTFSTFLSDKEI